MSNALSHTIRSFNRFELKYILTLSQAEVLRTALSAYLKPDEHGSTVGSYPLTSLYFDSPDHRCYWEKVDGIKYRRKLRIRLYGDAVAPGDDAPVMVEIKQRLDHVTQKRRAVLPYREALRLCIERQLPEHAPTDDALVQEALAFIELYNLASASIVRYQRLALIGTDYDIGLRVTFDTNLTYQLAPLDLRGEPSAASLLPPNLAVMEIKVNERIPYWLTELVAHHNLRLERLSKYCCSIEAGSRLMNTQTASSLGGMKRILSQRSYL